MTNRITLKDSKLSRLEKIASDLRIISDDLSVEILTNQEGAFPVKFQVRQTPHTFRGMQVEAIAKYCHKRGIYFSVHAFEHDGDVDLYILIY